MFACASFCSDPPGGTCSFAAFCARRRRGARRPAEDERAAELIDCWEQGALGARASAATASRGRGARSTPLRRRLSATRAADRAAAAGGGAGGRPPPPRPPPPPRRRPPPAAAPASAAEADAAAALRALAAKLTKFGIDEADRKEWAAIDAACETFCAAAQAGAPLADLQARSVGDWRMLATTSASLEKGQGMTGLGRAPFTKPHAPPSACARPRRRPRPRARSGTPPFTQSFESLEVLEFWGKPAVRTRCAGASRGAWTASARSSRSTAASSAVSPGGACAPLSPLSLAPVLLSSFPPPPPPPRACPGASSA